MRTNGWVTADGLMVGGGLWPVGVAIFLAGVCVEGVAAEGAGDGLGSGVGGDKSGYHLFEATSRGQMRELSTDRPDKTESAYTVDAGHVQIESDLVAYGRDRDRAAGADTLTEAWSVGAVNFKVGLLNWMDVQWVVESYNRVTTEDRVAGTKVRQRGFGDVTTRVKMNLWGNDGGRTALALMPFVKAPTNADDLGNDDVEGGLILPLAVELPWGWGMGVMTEVDFVRNGADTGYEAEFVNTITFGHDIVGPLAGYVEFFSLVSSESGVPWVGTFDVGLTYAITEDIQLDAGVNIGVTSSAEDVNPFVGISWRF